MVMGVTHQHWHRAAWNRCEFLSSFIDDYVDHIALYPKSLLPRFMGSYAIHIYNSVFYFLVSNNLFHTAQVRVLLFSPRQPDSDSMIPELCNRVFVSLCADDQ